MCKVCAEAIHCLALCQAVHFVALWTRVTSQLRTCVKYVPKQSIPFWTRVTSQVSQCCVPIWRICGVPIWVRKQGFRCSYLTPLWCSYLSRVPVPRDGVWCGKWVSNFNESCFCIPCWESSKTNLRWSKKVFRGEWVFQRAALQVDVKLLVNILPLIYGRSISFIRCLQ